MCSGRSRLFGVKVYKFLIAVSIDLAGKTYANQRHFVHLDSPVGLQGLLAGVDVHSRVRKVTGTCC